MLDQRKMGEMNQRKKKKHSVRGIYWLPVTAGLLFLTFVFVKEYGEWLRGAGTFRIRNIEVTGNDLLSAQEIMKLAEVGKEKKIWDVDLGLSRSRILGNQFIEDVRIERDFPAGLTIRIQEKAPVAVLNADGRLFSIDRNGLILPSKPGRLYDLPVLSGIAGRQIKVGSILRNDQLDLSLDFLEKTMEEAPVLYTNISEIVLGRSEGLVLYTSERGVLVRVGKDQFKYKIRCLEAALQDLAEKKEFSQVRYIDLRFSGLVVVGKRT